MIRPHIFQGALRARANQSYNENAPGRRSGRAHYMQIGRRSQGVAAAGRNSTQLTLPAATSTVRQTGLPAISAPTR